VSVVESVDPPEVEVFSVSLVVDWRGDDGVGATVGELENRERHEWVERVVREQAVSLGAVAVHLETVALEELRLGDPGRCRY
jgi:hypothetical protein